jgi:hypothetical protein
MKKILVTLSVLAVIFCAAGCIFSNKDSEEASEVVANSLFGTWGRYGLSGVNYYKIQFGKFSSEKGYGFFSRYYYDVDKDGSLTQISTGSGEYWVELKKDGYNRDVIVLNFREQGNLVDTKEYEFSLNGNKLTLDGIVWTKE